MKQVEEMAHWIETEVFDNPFKSVKEVSHLDTIEVAKSIATVLRHKKDEPLTQIKSSVGEILLKSLDTQIDRDDDLYSKKVWLGNRILQPLVAHGICDFVNAGKEEWNGKINKSSWRISKNGNQISMKQKKSNDDGYVLEILEEGEEWMEGFLASVSEVEDVSKVGLPVFGEIEPFNSFQHHITGAPMIHGASRNTRRKIDQGKYTKFVDILNSRMQLKYVADQEIIKIYDEVKRDPLFTLSKKKMNAKQKKSVKDERSFAIEDARACGEREFSFYHFYDKRMGRIYCDGQYLKPDGSKVSKSLLHLANKKAIGTKGWFWMLVHAANTFGEDKLPIHDRFKFAEEHLDEWMVWASDPVKYKEEIDGKKQRPWTLVDDPFCFLASILEIKRALDYEVEHGSRYDFPSGLIIAFDASCSGLQVLSAISKCEISGAMCNVFGDKPSDFYLTIADDVWDNNFNYNEEDVIVYERVIKELKEVDRVLDFHNKIKELGDDVVIASKVFWGRLKDNRRKLAKRPCMTYFYSCKKETMAEAIFKDWKSEEGFDDINPAFSIILAELLYDACVRIMKRPTKVMDVIIEMAEKDRAKGEQLWLRTPYTGVIMEQTYYKPNKSKKVWCIHPEGDDKRFRLNVWNGYSKTINHHKVKSASAPNVVHMLDSQIVASVIDNAPYDVSCIHDSFGTIPANADLLFDEVRACFYDIFNEPVLENILKKKGYKDLIEKLDIGKGNLDDMLSNELCFS